MSTISERLREQSQSQSIIPEHSLMREAAERIEQLEAQLDAASEAVRLMAKKPAKGTYGGLDEQDRNDGPCFSFLSEG